MFDIFGMLTTTQVAVYPSTHHTSLVAIHFPNTSRRLCSSGRNWTPKTIQSNKLHHPPFNKKSFFCVTLKHFEWYKKCNKWILNNWQIIDQYFCSLDYLPVYPSIRPSVRLSIYPDAKPGGNAGKHPWQTPKNPKLSDSWLEEEKKSYKKEKICLLLKLLKREGCSYLNHFLRPSCNLIWELFYVA